MALCYPDTAIWPDPSILPVEPDAPVDPDDLTPEEEAAAALYALESEQVEIALSLGWTTLQSLSAFQISICPVTIRPCKKSCAYGSYFVAPVQLGSGLAPFWPYVRNGQWFNSTCGHWNDCGCTTIREVTLPGPVGEVVEVVIDGEILDPESYRVDNGNRLVRQDGELWPACQDFNLPMGEVGTWSVTYSHGATADILVRYAAGVLASEYLASMQGRDCRLPSGTTNIVRQGITIEVQTDLFESLTGIPEVGAVIMRYNPYGQRMPSRVFSPDRKLGRIITTAGS